jgi:acyl-coenzyme A thioesterase PaaI-like protein
VVGAVLARYPHRRISISRRPFYFRSESRRMPESLESRIWRWRTNLFPAYWATGARVTYLAADTREVRVRLPLTLRTRNYVGTIFGGSMYGAIDPIYMIMLIRNLGPDYVVWDKAASIRFRKPGRTTLFARFVIDDAELDAIRDELTRTRAIDRIYHVDLADAEGVVHASFEKILHIRRRRAGKAGRPPKDSERTQEEQ